MASKDKSIPSLLHAYETGTFKPKAMPPLTRLVYGIVVDSASPPEAQAAIHRMQTSFINWNELRVARWVEIARCLDPLPDADACAIRLRNMLGRLFELRGAMDLDFLAEMKVTDARKALLDLDGNLPREEINLILFEMVPGMTIPLSMEGLQVARKLGIVGRTGNKNQVQKRLQEECPPPEAARMVHYIEAEAHALQTASSAPKPKPASKAKPSRTKTKTAAPTKEPVAGKGKKK